MLKHTALMRNGIVMVMCLNLLLYVLLDPGLLRTLQMPRTIMVGLWGHIKIQRKKIDLLEICL